jgi:mono/diheme cytochrome c family protein
MRIAYRVSLCISILLIIALAGFPKTFRQGTSKAANKGNNSQAQIERGKYLVEEVARCSECHTPRDSQGNLDNSRALQGAPIWILPVRHNSNWADQAPPLAGFPGYSEQDGEKILEKGQGLNGESIRPPMHTYHLKHEDAVAIIAYLKSLPGSTK